MLLLCTLPLGAAEHNSGVAIDYDVLLLEKLTQDEAPGAVYKLVSVQEQWEVEIQSRFTPEELSHAKAVQSTRIVDGVVELTTMYPYKELDDGTLVNSFVYANSAMRDEYAVLGDAYDFYNLRTFIRLRYQKVDMFGFTNSQHPLYHHACELL